jgi:hypothetical protein
MKVPDPRRMQEEIDKLLAELARTDSDRYASDSAYRKKTDGMRGLVSHLRFLITRSESKRARPDDATHAKAE